MVEAQNKILKYRYLFRREYLNIKSLSNDLQWIIDDYNNKRPHIALEGLTPSEAYTGEKISKKALAVQFDVARKSRYQENTANPCEICE
jgi:putative transposase